MNATFRKLLGLLSPPRVVANTAPRGAIECIVDDRVFLLGLDDLYRRAMMRHESTELLACARRVARELGVSPAAVPVEGYYVASAQLTEYFRLIRALQTLNRTSASQMAKSRELRRLQTVLSAPLFGRAVQGDALLPGARDSLSDAVEESGADPAGWTVASLVALASARARATGDISLVGLAALVGDAVVLAASRESMVLYALSGATAAPPMEELPGVMYVWRVTEELARRASRFVSTFNALFADALPEPIAGNAKLFFDAADQDAIVGRCVCLGQTTSPPRFYHWAIRRRPDGTSEVEEFWASEIWTTARYRSGPPGA